MDKVSIVIPVYNCEKYLDECLNSVIKQTYNNIEVLLIDDGSTDLSGKICDVYSEKDSRFKTFHIKNGGVSNARNTGINEATGKYITFIDADDIVSEYFIEKMVFGYKDDVGLVVCNYTCLYKDTEVYKPYDIQGIISSETAKKELFKDNSIRGFSCNKMFLLKTIKDNNLLFDINIKICEDLLFCFTYMNFIKNISIINEKHYFYRMRKGSALNNSKIKNDLTVFDSYKKMYNIDNRVYEYSKELYTYLFFKYYKALKKNNMLDSVYKVAIGDMIKNKNISFKQKLIILCHRYLSKNITNFLNKKKQSKYNYYE